MNELHRNRAAMGALAAGFVLASLAVLAIRTLVPPDEGRYAEIAREMFASGDWITTRLNGIKYFEKPPLQAWMNALTFTLFGVGEWQARLWTGLCGILGVLLTGLAGTRVFGARAGLYAALVLGSCFYWVLGSQVDSVDMGVSGMMTISLCALLLAQRDDAGPRTRRNWMLACWAGMALATLSKGLIGLVLPGGVLVCYTVIARDWRLWTRLHIVKGLALFLAIAAPWFILVGLRNPEQPHFFFVHEHLERFLLKEHHREAPCWVFLVLLAAGSMPWLGVLVPGLAAGARRTAPEAAGTFRPRLLALVWLVFIVAFFSASSSKLPGYILPVFPALALLVGCHLEHASRRSRMINAASLVLMGLLLLLAAPFAPDFARHDGEATLYAGFAIWINLAGMLALCGGVLALWMARHRRLDGHVLAVALSGFLASQVLLAGFEPLGQARAGALLVPAMRAVLTPDTHLYSVGLYEQSLTFYLGRPVTLVDYTDEFAFGLQQQPALGIATLDAFIRAWQDDAARGIPSLAIARADLVFELQHRHVPLRVVASDARRVVIANPRIPVSVTSLHESHHP
jgi:4-amino-4-deoxy-L-arabinose transferase-like glycosyltransferase